MLPDRLLSLRPHPASFSTNSRDVTAGWSTSDGNDALVTFIVTEPATVALPAPAIPSRTDGLWRTTCFELFWKLDGGDAYVEMNFSPSGRWAAYAFDNYREGMRDHPITITPRIVVDRNSDRLVVSIGIDGCTLPPAPARIGISAVIEDLDGTTSCWALDHPAGPPDFHHDDCFAWRIPAVGTP